MAGQSSDDLLAMFDGAPLNRRYWLSFGLLSAITVLDFFDFFLIAFILSKIGPEWQLTYGQSGLILYGGGIGADCTQNHVLKIGFRVGQFFGHQGAKVGLTAANS